MLVSVQQLAFSNLFFRQAIPCCLHCKTCFVFSFILTSYHVLNGLRASEPITPCRPWPAGLFFRAPLYCLHLEDAFCTRHNVYLSIRSIPHRTQKYRRIIAWSGSQLEKLSINHTYDIDNIVFVCVLFVMCCLRILPAFTRIKHILGGCI